MGFVVALNLSIYFFNPFEDDHPHKTDKKIFLPVNKLSNSSGLIRCNIDASGSKLIVMIKIKVIIVQAKHPQNMPKLWG